MTVAVCVDDNGGMLFNNRRQSRDRELISEFCRSCKDIFVNSYTAPLFAGYSVTVCDDPLCASGVNGTCFIENLPLSPYADKIGTLIIYRWNRAYPSDVKLDIDLSGYDLISVSEFKGFSHEKITKEIYEKCSL